MGDSTVTATVPLETSFSSTTTADTVKTMSTTITDIDEPKPPPTPNPASDAATATAPIETTADDLANLPATDALRLLGAGVELLVRLTGDVPPTPPPKTPTDPQMTGLQAEKEVIARSNSERDLAAKRKAAEDLERRQAQAQTQTVDKVGSGLQAYSVAMVTQLMAQQAALSPAPEPIDGVRMKTPPTSRSPPPAQETPFIIVGDDANPVNVQHGAITRKFYSKKEPPISIQQYLLRLHQFCPMSTAVYLATSLYIHRLAVTERAIPVTKRNAHRLVLAGLRVAMKALEDLSYPHGKIARVGGVSEAELARLEISFCFLAGFELVVGEETLRGHWEALKRGRAKEVLGGLEPGDLRIERKMRTVA